MKAYDEISVDLQVRHVQQLLMVLRRFDDRKPPMVRRIAAQRLEAALESAEPSDPGEPSSTSDPVDDATGQGRR